MVCTYIPLQAQVVRDVCDLLGVGFGTLDEVRLQSRAHGSLQTGPPLSFPGVQKHALDLVHLRKSETTRVHTALFKGDVDAEHIHIPFGVVYGG